MYFKTNQIQSCYIDLIETKNKEKKIEILHRYIIVFYLCEYPIYLYYIEFELQNTWIL